MKAAIIELEEGSLTLTIAVLPGRQPRVTTCFRMPLQDIHGVVLGNTLRSLLAEIPEDFGKVHVILGERRIHHFTSQVPWLPAEELRAFAQRESLRVGGLTQGTEYCSHTRFCGRLPDKRIRLGTTVLARSVWAPLAKAFAESGIEVLSLHSIEDMLAAAVPKELPERTAVLEFTGGKARFVLAEGGAPAHVRRFLVPGIDAAHEFEPALLAAQLAMEVPRTLDYLRENKIDAPQTLLLSHRLGIADGDLDLFRGDIGDCVVYAPDVFVEDDQAVPGMATMALVRRLALGQRGRSLLDGVTLEMPARPLRHVAVAAAVVFGFACGAVATIEQGRIGGMQAQLLIADCERQRFERELAYVSAPAAEVEATPEQERLQAALGTRRPLSRLLAEVSARLPAGAALEEIQFGADDRVAVQGVVEADTRLQALTRLGDVASSLKGLGYVVADGKEEVTGTEGGQHRLHFRFHMTWRRP